MWKAELGCFKFEIEHRSGAIHSNADALSRLKQCEQYDLKHKDPKKRRNVKKIKTAL